ncbi:hypothetical protein B0A50_07928 [Salinomyces thailandicus]|uniref:Uncharacterized protein n=1 Tax=Salinomyces thailandicus TaxID=706561 RepID=A0A4U0TL29_9PEZI|nr:hypothetical protein B0A50_07928 [Salinomyces thailandica]
MPDAPDLEALAKGVGREFSGDSSPTLPDAPIDLTTPRLKAASLSMARKRGSFKELVAEETELARRTRKRTSDLPDPEGLGNGGRAAEGSGEETSKGATINNFHGPNTVFISQRSSPEVRGMSGPSQFGR